MNSLCPFMPPGPANMNINDVRFCSCRNAQPSCVCGETIQDFEWRWDASRVNPETISLSHQNRETMFHPRASSGTTAIRGETPFQKGHVYYWEVKILSSLYGTNFIVGVGTKNANLESPAFCSLIGADKESWGYSYRGSLHHDGQVLRDGARQFGEGSIVGVKLDMWNGTLEFYLNRTPLGATFSHLGKHDELYPIVCSTSAKSAMRLISTSSRPTGLMHHCLLSLRDHYQHTKELRGIPSVKRLLDKSWWSFSDDEVLYPDSVRKRAYHWSNEELPLIFPIAPSYINVRLFPDVEEN